MKNLTTVTLVAVGSTKIEETVKAMKKSMEGIKYAEALLITDAKPNLDNTDINLISIDKLDYKGYNHFILYRLKDYIKTDFALVVQYDGYVLRPDEWREEFLNYDYIGAPWMKGIHYTPERVNVRVGNGGFSLRSKKLLEAPTNLSIPFDDNGSGFFNEDGILCVHYRKQFEDFGIIYAPVEVAAKFSQEKKCDDFYPTPFGFHNKPPLTTTERIRKLSKKVKFKVKDLRKLNHRIISSVINDIKTSTTIAQKPKGIKVYDIFTFLNELDLLEIRLNILDPYVDYFVIVEATETFSGKPKPLSYQDNKDRFKKWHYKIIHHVIDDTPQDEAALRAALLDPSTSQINKWIMTEALKSDNVGRNSEGKIITVWLREFFQKESIRKALTSLSDNDFCFVSDVDEIWNPKAKINMKSERVFKIRQKMYSYFLNNRSSEPWIGPMATQYKNIKEGILNHLRTERKMDYVYVRNGGWHFTNQGGSEQIKRKLESYGHQEYNTDKIKSQIEKQIEKNQDFIGRKFKFWKDEKDLPQYILDNKEKYKSYFRN